MIYKVSTVLKFNCSLTKISFLYGQLFSFQMNSLPKYGEPCFNVAFFGSLTFNMSAANVTSANSDHPDTDQPDHSRIRPYK